MRACCCVEASSQAATITSCGDLEAGLKCVICPVGIVTGIAVVLNGAGALQDAVGNRPSAHDAHPGREAVLRKVAGQQDAACWVHSEGCRCDSRNRLAIARAVGEVICSTETGRGCVGEAAIRVQAERAICRSGHESGREVGGLPGTLVIRKHTRGRHCQSCSCVYREGVIHCGDRNRVANLR